MKRAAIPVCLLAILLLFTSTVAAGSSWETREFTITGWTTSMVPLENVPPGKIGFRITAEGTVSGDIFDGDSFSFTEWVIADPETFEGYNAGLLTIQSGNNNSNQNCSEQLFGGDKCGHPPKAVIGFSGTANLSEVTGHFTVLNGSGKYRDIQGHGEYTGIPDLGQGFWVTYSGSFYTRQ